MASCPIFAARARGSSPRERSPPTDPSWRTRCWPSTTRTTCPRKSPTASRTRESGSTPNRLPEHAMVETGHFALILAFALALVQSVLPLWGARTGNMRLMSTGGPVAITGFAMVLIAFAALIAAYVRSDVSVVNVFENSHSAKPLLYRITGAWGNHEGSM